MSKLVCNVFMDSFECRASIVFYLVFGAEIVQLIDLLPSSLKFEILSLHTNCKYANGNRESQFIP